MPQRLLDFSTGAQRWLPSMEQASANDAVRAGNTFDNRIMTEALPIDRMIGKDGKVDFEGIQKQNAFPDPDEMWRALQDDLAGTGRSVDPVMFQEKYKAGEQIFKENKFKEIDFMRRSGMSDKEIRKAIGTNKNLLDYVYRNPEIGLEPPPKPINIGGLLKGAGSLGLSIGAGMGIDRAIRSNLKVKPTLSGMKELRSLGFTVKNVNGKRVLQELSDKELYNKPRVKGAENAAQAVKDAKDDVRRKKARRNIKLRQDKLYKKAAKGNRSALNKILANSGVRLKGLKGLARRGKIGATAAVGTAGILGLIDYLTED